MRNEVTFVVQSFCLFASKYSIFIICDVMAPTTALTEYILVHKRKCIFNYLKFIDLKVLIGVSIIQQKLNQHVAFIMSLNTKSFVIYM